MDEDLDVNDARVVKFPRPSILSEPHYGSIPDMVGRLERVIELVQRGEIKSIFLAAAKPEGGTYLNYCHSKGLWLELLGAVELAKASFIDDNLGGKEDDTDE